MRTDKPTSDDSPQPTDAACAAGPASKREKYFILTPFPFPGRDLTLGQIRGFAIADALARYQRMQGKEVLFPIGWDEFGKAAEEAAIREGCHPAELMEKRRAGLKEILQRYGFSFDWSREFATSDPAFIRAQQDLFVKMYEKGLIYRKTITTNWCPRCESFLRGDLLRDNKCWRCDTEIQQPLPGWYLKTSAYAEELWQGLTDLDGWHHDIRNDIRNELGRQEWLGVKLPVADTDITIEASLHRPEWLYGATYVTISPLHPRLAELIKGTAEEENLPEFIRTAEYEKPDLFAPDTTAQTPGAFTGRHCVHPLTGKQLPIHVAFFMLDEINKHTEAQFGVPAHSRRDQDFAAKLKLPARQVISSPAETAAEEVYTGQGTMINSGEFDTLPSEQAAMAITEKLTQLGMGRTHATFRIWDWRISRQGFWGVPIPMLFCDHCGPQPIAAEALPLQVPERFFTRNNEWELPAEAEQVYATVCPQCGNPAQRDPDIINPLLDTCLSIFRALNPTSPVVPVDKSAPNPFLPVDQFVSPRAPQNIYYHTLILRTVTKILRDLEVIDCNEPFTKVLCQGHVSELDIDKPSSWHKGKAAQEAFELFGSDIVRLSLLQNKEPTADLEWGLDSNIADNQPLQAYQKFVTRLSDFVVDHQEALQAAAPMPDELNKESRTLRRQTHQTSKRVTEKIEQQKLHDAANGCLSLANSLLKSRQQETAIHPAVQREALETLLLLLSPFTPHLCAELREAMGNAASPSASPWPQWDEEVAKEEERAITVQVNGKTRARIIVPATATEEEVVELAQQDEKVRKCLGGQEIVKTFRVEGKLVNLATRSDQRG